jgi:hypothetical protein
MAKKDYYKVKRDDLGYSLVSAGNCTIGPCRNLATLTEAASRAFAGQPDKQTKAKEAIDLYKNS